MEIQFHFRFSMFQKNKHLVYFRRLFLLSFVWRQKVIVIGMTLKMVI